MSLADWAGELVIRRSLKQVTHIRGTDRPQTTGNEIGEGCPKGCPNWRIVIGTWIEVHYDPCDGVIKSGYQETPEGNSSKRAE